MITKTIHVAWISALFLIGQLHAQTKHEFTVLQAADYAKKNNVQVKNALLDVKIQQEMNRELTAQALPSLTGFGNATDNVKLATQLLPGELAGQPAGTFIPVTFGTKYVVNGGFSLRQALFDGQVFIGLKARSSSIDVKQKTVDITANTINKNVYKIYYQLVVAKKQVELIDSNISRLEKLQHDTREIYKNGFAEKIDVDKTEVQLANLQTQRIKTISNIDGGYYSLKLLMGMPIRDSLVLTDEITDDQLKQGLLQEKFQYSDRAEYQSFELQKKLQEYNVRRYKLSYIPTLSLTGNYSYSGQRTRFDFFDKSGLWFPSTYYGLNLNVPIFEGFAKKARVQQAKLQLQQSANNLENSKLIIDNDVEQARVLYESAIKSIDFQRRNMTLAEEVYNQAKKKYEIGTGSNTEISAAQTDLVQAQTNYISSVYDAIIARTDYLYAIGKLP